MGGIRDRVAIVGVGCTKFGEIWEKDQEDLLVEAVYEALDDAGLTPQDIEAGWVGVMYPFTGMSGATLVEPMKLYGKPVTRVENFCASGMDAFRNACFAVAAGVYDIVLACGVEKLMDQGASGLPIEPPHPVLGIASAPGLFAMAAARAFHEWGWTKEDLARVAIKNHKNGAAHPKAHFRRPVSMEDVLSAPMIAWPLGRFDCCAVSDGAAAIVITRPEIAKDTKHKDDYVVVKANALAIHSSQPMYRPAYDWLGFPATRDAARMAYDEAGIKDPRQEISFAEVHDCFTSTELFNLGDLGFCEPKEANAFVRDGLADVEGDIPINPSGGLNCFGHPIGATGCRMLYEVTKQLQGRADGHQVKDPRLGLAHNLGGPGSVCSVTILGMRD
ncbi:MAG: acetyl-CoA acetyltransferase [Chloroflexota bacterium]|nr:acetyl-CoA acetyltransferase [Chloroflexota bacterium]